MGNRKSGKRWKRADSAHGIHQRADSFNRDADFVSRLESERVGRDDADACHQIAAMRETVFAKEPVGERRGGCSPELGLTGVEWGVYGPAIHRWERALGRVAPAPTAPGRRGGQQLAPQFVEWMMGLPAGHVTDVSGLSRNEMLKVLGNGVVPHQAAEAVRWLLARQEANI